jgi:RNA polymerase sigma-70 factor (ECF subfamily)
VRSNGKQVDSVSPDKSEPGMNEAEQQKGGAWVESAMREHQAGLLRYAARLTGDTEAARDVTQDVFLRLCREAPAELNGRLRPWLYTVCRNRALEIRRRDGRARSGGELERVATAEELDPAKSAEAAEGSSSVLLALGALPSSQQEAVRLKFEHGLSYKEISTVMEITVSHVGVLIHTALKTIRTRMKE